MPKLIYRVVSACGALGYGYPKESLQAALKGQVDAIICDGGSMDAGPYYLGTGTEYFEAEAVKADFRHMVEAGNKIGCPVILAAHAAAKGHDIDARIPGHVEGSIIGEFARRRESCRAPAIAGDQDADVPG